MLKSKFSCIPFLHLCHHKKISADKREITKNNDNYICHWEKSSSFSSHGSVRKFFPVSLCLSSHLSVFHLEVLLHKLKVQSKTLPKFTGFHLLGEEEIFDPKSQIIMLFRFAKVFTVAGEWTSSKATVVSSFTPHSVPCELEWVYYTSEGGWTQAKEPKHRTTGKQRASKNPQRRGPQRTGTEEALQNADL